MINSYYIKNINGEEVLYLNFDFSYEFSSFDFMAKREKIQEVVRNFIRDNRIVFKGVTVLLVSGGVLFGSINLNTPSFSGISIENPVSYVEETDILDFPSGIINDDVSVENISDKEILNDTLKEDFVETVYENPVSVNNEEWIDSKANTTNKSVSNNEVKHSNDIQASVISNENSMDTVIKEEVKAEIPKEEVKVELVDDNIYVSVRRGGSVVKVELEQYVIGVVGAEMPASFNIEALKAQAVIARTYALKANSYGTVLSDNESSQSYKSNDELKSLWGSSYGTYYDKVKSACDNTRGMYLTYNGSYIEAVYHSTSNGKTEDSSNVWGNSFPYLVSVDSPYDNSNPSFLKSISFSYSDISKRLDVIVTHDTDFIINGKTSGDRVNSITVGEITFTGIQFRNKLGLRSADFDIEKTDLGVIITTRGYGHGVGMSQYGANGMAKNGSSYRDILFHYYPGVSLNLL